MAQGWGPGQGGGHYGPPASYAYGYPPRPPAPKKTSGCVIALAVLGGLFLLGIVAGAVGGKSGGRASRGASSEGARAASVTEADSTPPHLEVDAVTLFNDYQANEVSADDKYKNKTLLVRGKVTDISKDFLGDVVIKFGTPNPFMNVMATMKDGEAGKAARLSKGEPLTVRCEGGGMVIGSPMLRNCVIP